MYFEDNWAESELKCFETLIQKWFKSQERFEMDGEDVSFGNYVTESCTDGVEKEEN